MPTGLTGISQAGWIAPLAAVGNPNVAFVVLWSGPVCRVSEEDIFSKYTKDLDGSQTPSYQEALRSRTAPYVWPAFLGEDTNPADSLTKLDVPGLWIFGQRDGSVPVDLSIDRLDTLIKAGHAFEHRLFSDLGHNNIPETFATAVGWIKKTVRTPKQP